MRRPRPDNDPEFSDTEWAELEYPWDHLPSVCDVVYTETERERGLRAVAAIKAQQGWT